MTHQTIWDLNERSEFLRVHRMRSWMREDGLEDTPYIAISDNDRPPAGSYLPL